MTCSLFRVIYGGLPGGYSWLPGPEEAAVDIEFVDLVVDDPERGAQLLGRLGLIAPAALKI